MSDFTVLPCGVELSRGSADTLIGETVSKNRAELCFATLPRGFGTRVLGIVSSCPTAAG